MNDTAKKLLTPVTAGNVYCNGRIKFAPDGTVLEVMYTSRPVFNALGLEPLEPELRGKLGPYSRGENAQSRARAGKRVFELAACNSDVLTHFITLTLDGAKVDRYDYTEVYKRLRVWLDNRVRRKGLAYVIVPERHKDGAIHLHGVVNGEALRLVASGHYDKQGRPVFNVADWPIGRVTTAVRTTGDPLAVCKYITKYIRKQADQGLIGGRYYLHGGDLKEPHYRYIYFDAVPDGKTFPIEGAGMSVTYVTDLAKCQYQVVEG